MKAMESFIKSLPTYENITEDDKKKKSLDNEKK